MKSNPKTYWHFLPADGKLAYAPGTTVRVNRKLMLPSSTRIIPCRVGFHASARATDALYYAHGPIACLVTLHGDIVSHGNPIDKYAAHGRTVLKMADATETLQAFSRWCALSVIHLWDAPQIVYDYLNTGDKNLWAEAWNASKAAAWDASKDAVWGASRAAACDAAWDESKYAAWDESRAAAWDASKTAALYASKAAAWDASKGDVTWDESRAAALCASKDAALYASRAAAWAASNGDAAWAASKAAAWNASKDAAKTNQNAQLEMMLHKLLDEQNGA